MVPYERQTKILESLQLEELLKIEDLHKKMPDISISTLRRDLKELEKNGKIVMLTGGAAKLATPGLELSIATKQTLHSKEKEKIAELAAALINEGEVIYLDSGTTCTALLNKIIHKKISIVTTNASVLNVPEDTVAEITILGGKLNPRISSLNGPLTDENIQKFYFDKAFLGANGVDPKRGVSTPDLVEATKKQNVIKNARKAYLLCDSSKFYQNATVKAFDLAAVTIVTDKEDERVGKQTQLIYP